MAKNCKNISKIVEQLKDGQLTVDDLLKDYPVDCISAVVTYMKQEANNYWSIDPSISLHFANLIIDIGEKGDSRWHIALGMMAKGDALKLLSNANDAWDASATARKIFIEEDDEVYWARACIGPLHVCVDVNRVDEALENAEKARQIFEAHDENGLLIELCLNLGNVYNWRGNSQQALEVLHEMLEIVEALPNQNPIQVGLLLLNIGYSNKLLGDFREAEQFFNRAIDGFQLSNATHWIATAEMNIASIAKSQGHYRRALQLFHDVREATDGKSPLMATKAKHGQAVCYIELNRYDDARNLARQVVDEYAEHDAQFNCARAYLNLATAEAELSDYEAAEQALQAAEAILNKLEMSALQGFIDLWRSKIALRNGDSTSAYRLASAAASQYQASDQLNDYAHAMLVKGQALLATGAFAGSVEMASKALQIAQQNNNAHLRYSAHLLLGKVAEVQQAVSRARRHYQAATKTIERVQHGLTITMRSEFLEDKDEASRALLRLYIENGDVACAFETLERAKSHVSQSYLNSRDSLHWNHDDSRVRDWYAKLESLREEHQWYYQQMMGENVNGLRGEVATSSPDIRQELKRREKEMRETTELLYLYSHHDQLTAHRNIPSVIDIQQRLKHGSTLIEYYNDGHRFWAFTLDHDHIAIHPLAVTVDEINLLIRKFQFNIDCAIKMGRKGNKIDGLTQICRQLGKRFYDALIAPLASRLRGQDRLVIVPYGALHYLPFHTLYSGNSYLIEDYEVVILPAASIVTQPTPQRTSGSVVLAHSQNGHLPHTIAEAEIVNRLFNGDVYCDDEASRAALRQPPRQILHIAAHGEFRIDHPDLAFIMLADGQLYTDDLLQHDLSYELITLSACETGRANVAAGDEIIGLGRGCLYAGAGALLVTQWRVEDDTALTLMDTVYRKLSDGASKATSVRMAQCNLLGEKPSLHPAFWGAFQLIGNPDPLSTTVE